MSDGRRKEGNKNNWLVNRSAGNRGDGTAEVRVQLVVEGLGFVVLGKEIGSKLF